MLFAEGFREVERALEAGLACRAVWSCPSLLGDRVAPSAPAGADRIEASAPVFEKIAWHRRPEGLLAEFVAPRRTLDTLPPTRPESLYLAAVETEKPGNLGAMIRTAAAAGCDAVLAVGPHVDPFHPAAIRNSTAAVFSLPVVAVEQAGDAIAFLRGRGVRIHAAVVGAEAAPPPEAPVAVVIGPEDRGLSRVWTDAADRAVGIPLAPGPVDSLNAAAAAAVLLFGHRREAPATRGGSPPDGGGAS